MKKNKNRIINFLNTFWKGIISVAINTLNIIGKIINGFWQFFLWFWEEAISFAQWFLHIIGTIIDRFGKFFLWIWGFLLATALVGAIIFWIVSIGIKNIDATNGAQKFWEKSDPLIEMKVNFIEAMFQYHLKKEINRKSELCTYKEETDEAIEKCQEEVEELFENFLK